MPTHLAARPLRDVFRAAASLRRARPLHPDGVTAHGTLHVDGGDWGVPVLDTPAAHPVLARLSRAAGTPPPLPDILGLAIRLPGTAGADGHDLLLSTAGRLPVARHVPHLHRRLRGLFGSIVPFRTARGPLLLAARPRGPAMPARPDVLRDALAGEGLSFAVLAATPLGPWRPVGRLVLRGPTTPEEASPRFDPVLRAHPDLPSYAFWAALREPAYAGAREGFPTRRGRAAP